VQKECAYVANRLSSMMNRPVAGNAWTARGIFGDSTITDGYSNLSFLHRLPYSRNLANMYNHAAAEFVRNDIGNHVLKNGDIVGLYYDGSRYQKRAWNEGYKNRANSHTGRIVIGAGGIPFVVHNVGGTVLTEPVADMLGGFGKTGITYVSRPAFTDGQMEHNYTGSNEYEREELDKIKFRKALER